MRNYVVENYENYKEENRLTTNNARKIEFVTTARIIDECVKSGMSVLDCAAGTGVYAFYLADKGMEVTATDITPRHVQIMEEILEGKPYHMETAVMDATDMSRFPDESFDVVLNMGPFYHLISEEQREKCLLESLRVLKKGGLLFTAYIPRFYVCQLLAMTDTKYLDNAFLENMLNTGVMRHDDEKCFWTDTYYATKEEMEELYRTKNLEIVDHFAQDGLAPFMAKTVDAWSEAEFDVWCQYHYKVCRQASLLGQSNHVMIVGRKQ